MPMNSYQAAFMNLDSDGPQYISSNNGDEQSHAAFLNAYLQSIGARAVNFDQFRTLPSSQATGAQNIGRLTNLMNLTVDTKLVYQVPQFDEPRPRSHLPAGPKLG